MENEYTHVIFNLFIVTSLIIILFFILKKFKLGRYKNSSYIRVMHVLPIGAKEKILFVEVNNTFILLGVTANHIEKLHVFDSLNTEELKEHTANDYFSIAAGINSSNKME
ncbi:flagellar biosynthetic protein FliO [Aquicella lusitana]|uniref:Flagellar protein n=1 Tax=Aquicella lusitana TaxID=254246 RepID=A0A370G9V8_9COXI|nr:flagellar biosynthetic protein FliO [Aquicella lusitana]RDI39966.1 flagellar biosynthetic protein FliO [Aquicella lusitana]VVC74569.1 hypothetical protein AQULUS_23350 [Aquicella lusitana]